MSDYMPVQNQRYTPLGRALSNRGIVDWGDDEWGQPGKLFWRTNRPDGMSVRAFSQRAREKTVSLLHITGRRLEEVRFSSYDHLAEYLPNSRHAALDEWANFIELRLGGNIRNIGTGYCPVVLSTVEDNAEDMLDTMFPLYSDARS